MVDIKVCLQLHIQDIKQQPALQRCLKAVVVTLPVAEDVTWW